MRNTTIALLSAALLGCTPTTENGTSPTSGVVADGDHAREERTTAELLHHLIGEWRDADATDGTVFEERWVQTTDSLLTGRGLVLSGLDTVFVEYLAIAVKDARVIYSATIPSQNGGGAVDFTLTSAQGDSLVFENPGHDFPRRITYAWSVAERNWHIRLTGQGRKGPREERLHFRSSTADPY